jgi:hypothetical protein
MFKSFSEFFSLNELTDAEISKATEIFLDVKGNKRYDEIFKGQDRLYYDLKTEKNFNTPTSEEIASFLDSKGYVLLDYLNGTCYKKGDIKRTLKIQKTLTRLERSDLAEKMNRDPLRASAKTSSFKVVISRHGVDIAAQSTDRDWTSCKEIRTGLNKSYVWSEIEAGALVAYLIKSEDLNIDKPVARITMGVFTLLEDVEMKAFFPTSEVYGNYGKSDFLDFVTNWCKNANEKLNSEPGKYLLDPRCHTDFDNIPKELEKPISYYRDALTKKKGKPVDSKSFKKIVKSASKKELLSFLKDTSAEDLKAMQSKDTNLTVIINKIHQEIGELPDSKIREIRKIMLDFIIKELGEDTVEKLKKMERHSPVLNFIFEK